MESDVDIYGVQDVAMANADQLRERAGRLLAMALNARDKGQIGYADKLSKQASDVLDEAEASAGQTPSRLSQPHSNRSNRSLRRNRHGPALQYTSFHTQLRSVRERTLIPPSATALCQASIAERPIALPPVTGGQRMTAP